MCIKVLLGLTIWSSTLFKSVTEYIKCMAVNSPFSFRNINFELWVTYRRIYFFCSYHYVYFLFSMMDIFYFWTEYSFCSIVNFYLRFILRVFTETLTVMSTQIILSVFSYFNSYINLHIIIGSLVSVLPTRFFRKYLFIPSAFVRSLGL